MYLLYVDFSSAFNTIDHDELLCIMHDLGFLDDAVEVIAAQQCIKALPALGAAQLAGATLDPHKGVMSRCCT